MTTTLSLSRLLRASWVHVAAAFIGLGGWTLFANRFHPFDEALTAALVQGTMSGTITIVLKRFLEWASGRMSGAAAALVPPAISASTIFLVLTTVHRLAGTPEVLATIAVPWLVSTIYALLYCRAITRNRKPPPDDRH